MNETSVPEPVAVDARAMVFWGRPRADVLAFLQSKGVSDKHALQIVDALWGERASSIRRDGAKVTALGALLVAAPAVYYGVWQRTGSWDLKFFAVLIVLGLYGLNRLTRGLMMLLAPRSIRGDLSA